MKRIFFSLAILAACSSGGWVAYHQLSTQVVEEAPSEVLLPVAPAQEEVVVEAPVIFEEEGTVPVVETEDATLTLETETEGVVGASDDAFFSTPVMDAFAETLSGSVVSLEEITDMVGEDQGVLVEQEDEQAVVEEATFSPEAEALHITLSQFWGPLWDNTWDAPLLTLLDKVFVDTLMMQQLFDYLDTLTAGDEELHNKVEEVLEDTL